MKSPEKKILIVTSSEWEGLYFKDTWAYFYSFYHRYRGTKGYTNEVKWQYVCISKNNKLLPNEFNKLIEELSKLKKEPYKVIEEELLKILKKNLPLDQVRLIDTEKILKDSTSELSFDSSSDEFDNEFNKNTLWGSFFLEEYKELLWELSKDDDFISEFNTDLYNLSGAFYTPKNDSYNSKLERIKRLLDKVYSEFLFRIKNELETNYIRKLNSKYFSISLSNEFNRKDEELACYLDVQWVNILENEYNQLLKIIKFHTWLDLGDTSTRSFKRFKFNFIDEKLELNTFKTFLLLVCYHLNLTSYEDLDPSYYDFYLGELVKLDYLMKSNEWKEDLYQGSLKFEKCLKLLEDGIQSIIKRREIDWK